MLAGELITTVMVGLFFILFLLAFIWAWRHRQLQDIEDVKFKVLEEDDEEFRDDLQSG
jgi:cbb3-type cytochrome oxidase maturation protein